MTGNSIGGLSKLANHYVYILRCRDKSLYTGYTTDLDKRLKAHQAGKASKCTRARLPVEMVYWETLATKGEALSREAELKKLSHDHKSKMIEAFTSNKPEET